MCATRLFYASFRLLKADTESRSDSKKGPKKFTQLPTFRIVEYNLLNRAEIWSKQQQNIYLHRIQTPLKGVK